MQVFSVIMAGGGGTRFWPLSRQELPKQLLNFSGNDILINETIKRYNPFIAYENTYIVTNQTQAEAMERHVLPQVPRENILKEPAARNTAPCILYAALHILAKHGDGILCVFPSDHYITDNAQFVQCLKKAVHAANAGNCPVAIGVKPSFPSTGFGYIKMNPNPCYEQAYPIERFVEKPPKDKAIQYVQSGDYLWNSGMFIWKASVAAKTFQRFLPRIYNKLVEIQDYIGTKEELQKIQEIYPQLESISVDYGIMERLDNALVVPGDFGWNDVGSWDALGAVFPADQDGNIVKAEHVGVETKECIIYGHDKLIATVGLHNMIVVDTKDAVLICSKEKAQNVKYVVDQLKTMGKEELI